MDNNELNNQEPQSNNGWQNTGVCYKYARDKVPAKLRPVFMEIVDRSFGLMKHYTKRFSHKQWALNIGVSERTFYSHIHELIELEAVSVNVSSMYKKDGGSEAFSYSPVYPTGYGKIIFKEDKLKEPATVVLDNKKPKPVDNIY